MRRGQEWELPIMTQILIPEAFLSIYEYPPCAGSGTIRMSHACVTHGNTQILGHGVTLFIYREVWGRASSRVHTHVCLGMVSPRCLTCLRSVKSL